MILSDTQILQQIQKGRIVIDPFDRDCLGSNSYDVHLGKYLSVYTGNTLDAKLHNKTKKFVISPQGFLLQPGELYLGVTKEYTETLDHIPFLEGKSSTGRLGLSIHATAGKGDVGFCNYWTLEITVTKPIKVYYDMPIGQLIYFKVFGDVERKYMEKPGAKYTEKSEEPIESMMWKNKF